MIAHREPFDYPYEARAKQMTGTGIFLLRVPVSYGNVRQVIVARSTGYALLDACAVRSLEKWRFRPGTVPRLTEKLTSLHLNPPLHPDETLIKVPITFTLGHAEVNIGP